MRAKKKPWEFNLKVTIHKARSTNYVMGEGGGPTKAYTGLRGRVIANYQKGRLYMPIKECMLWSALIDKIDLYQCKALGTNLWKCQFLFSVMRRTFLYAL